ncbi:hypothetical protein HUG15_21150 [Salicibibacter cibarius]|uniref:Uncharacterized protein n=1 Tax=Salicibibacter cibarius TaxID=2743000 RepID=A0A7T6Z6H4_9BACI|nr:hypothetical protein [Salicibibacter cibarius]QQK77836.1 hypothetical protein HUG15_21150 [Salicibibacter cibarius]
MEEEELLDTLRQFEDVLNTGDIREFKKNNKPIMGRGRMMRDLLSFTPHSSCQIY